MPIRAYLQFYKDIVPFNVAFTIICITGLGLSWGFLLFSTLGLLVGFIGFTTFKKDEYYFYYNLGISKWSLLKASFIINILIGILVFAILFLLKTFFFG